MDTRLLRQIRSGGALPPEAQTQIRLMAEQMAEDRIALSDVRAENARLREGLKMISDGCPQPRLVARGVLFHEECRAARAPHSADA
jgi:hypothetical protein